MGLCRLCRPQSSRNRITSVRCNRRRFRNSNGPTSKLTSVRHRLASRNSHNRRMGLKRKIDKQREREREKGGKGERETSNGFPMDDDKDFVAVSFYGWFVHSLTYGTQFRFVATVRRRLGKRGNLHAHSPHAQGTSRSCNRIALDDSAIMESRFRCPSACAIAKSSRDKYRDTTIVTVDEELRGTRNIWTYWKKI